MYRHLYIYNFIVCLLCELGRNRNNDPKLLEQFGVLKEFECLLGSDILFPYRSPSHRPHPDPTQHPRNGPETDPEQTRNGAKRSQTEPNGAKRSRNGPKSSPLTGGFDGMGGVGVVREKEYHYSWEPACRDCRRSSTSLPVLAPMLATWGDGSRERRS